MTRSLVGLLLLAMLCHCAGRPAPADLVLTNGAIYTVNPAAEWIEALAIRGGRIVYAGDVTGVGRFEGEKTRVVDLGGRFVLPAFHDTHIHAVDGGLERAGCSLAGIATRSEVLARIKACAAALPAGEWLAGSGWEYPLFENANPRKELLDTVTGSRPASFESADGHSLWANSAALAAAGITRATPDPARGRIERDPTMGEPSGTLRESAAKLVSRLAPRPTPAQRLAALSRSLDELNRMGIVAFTEARADDDIVQTYLAADGAGSLTARVRAALSIDPNAGDEQVPTLVKRRADCRGKRVECGAVKLFLDGVIESKTAALLAPYLDRESDGPGPAGSGTPRFTPEALDRLVVALDREGFQIHMHAIGDRAVRMGLDALTQAHDLNGARDARPVLAHLELVDPADFPRFRKLSAVACFQPLWAWADPYITDLTLPIIGPERSQWLYPVGSLVKAGAMVAAGSDWPVSSANPLEAIQVGVTREDPQARSESRPWLPDQRVSLQVMIKACTLAGAYASFEESQSGTLEVGKLADIVVLDRNLFRISAYEIHSARVLLTLLEGKEVFRDAGWDSATPARKSPSR